MTRVIVISDNHAGHILGLTPPEYWREDVRSIHEPFWNWWMGNKAESYDVMLHLGDAVDGDGHKESTFHLTTDIDIQQEIAIKVIESANAKTHKFVSGTPYHCGTALDYDKAVARHFGDEISWMRKIDIEGVKINMAHTVVKSTTPVGGDIALKKQRIWNYIYAQIENDAPADLILRGHIHEYLENGDTRMRMRTVPALKIGNPDFDRYARKMQGGFYDVGFIELDIDNGKIKRLEPITGQFRSVKGYETI